MTGRALVLDSAVAEAVTLVDDLAGSAVAGNQRPAVTGGQ